MNVPWEARISGIVDGWLFAGDDPLPESLIIPLERRATGASERS
jgi:hypothetical protein